MAINCWERQKKNKVKELKKFRPQAGDLEIRLGLGFEEEEEEEQKD